MKGLQRMMQLQARMYVLRLRFSRVCASIASHRPEEGRAHADCHIIGTLPFRHPFWILHLFCYSAVDKRLGLGPGHNGSFSHRRNRFIDSIGRRGSAAKVEIDGRGHNRSPDSSWKCSVTSAQIARTSEGRKSTDPDGTFI